MRAIILCKCGCGNLTKPGRSYILNHPRKAIRTQDWKSKISLALGGDGLPKDKSTIKCLCGCNTLTNPGKKYIHGHNQRNVIVSQSARVKLSKQKIGDKNPAKRPETREKISVSVLKLELKGNKASNWQGGLSLIPYGQDWSEDLKDSIRKRDNYSCQLCYIKQEDLKIKLSIHHINYQKENCDPANLISLCNNCHAKTTSGNRERWKFFFSNRKKEVINE